MEKKNEFKRRRTVSESEKSVLQKNTKHFKTLSDGENENKTSGKICFDITKHDEAIAAAINFSQFGAEEEVISDIVLASSSKSDENIENTNK